MTLSVNVTEIEDLTHDSGFYDGTAVIEVNSEFGQLTINIPFEQKPTIDEGVKDALVQLKAFAAALQRAIVV